MAFQQWFSSVPLLDLSEDVASSKPFSELRREMQMYHLGVSTPPYNSSAPPAPVCAASAVLMEQQPSFPVVRVPPWWDREAPRVREARYSGINHSKDLKVAPFGFGTARLSCRKQLPSKRALKAGGQRLRWTGYLFMESIKLALNWRWAF